MPRWPVLRGLRHDRCASPRRMFVNFDLRRAASASDPGCTPILLQRDTHAPGGERGCAAATTCPRIRDDYCQSNSVWIAPSLRADMIFRKDKVSYLPFGRGYRCGGVFLFRPIGSLSWLRTGGLRRRGTTIRTWGHDHCKTTPTAR